MVLALLQASSMLLREAVSPLPDPRFARRVAIATAAITAFAIGGAITTFSRSRRLALPAQITAIDVASTRVLVPDPPATIEQATLARSELAAYAFEAFPAWAADHPARACPRHLLELNHYAPALHAVDPWGTPYQFACSPLLWTRSAGPDRLFETADDLSSTAP